MNDTQESAIREVTARILSMLASGHSEAEINVAIADWHPTARQEAFKRVKEGSGQ